MIAQNRISILIIFVQTLFVGPITIACYQSISIFTHKTHYFFCLAPCVDAVKPQFVPRKSASSWALPLKIKVST